MNRTISYKHNDEVFAVNISNPMTENFEISVNNVLCNCIRPEKLVEKFDEIIIRSIERYSNEKAIGLIQ